MYAGADSLHLRITTDCCAEEEVAKFTEVLANTSIALAAVIVAATTLARHRDRPSKPLVGEREVGVVGYLSDWQSLFR